MSKNREAGRRLRLKRSLCAFIEISSPPLTPGLRRNPGRVRRARKPSAGWSNRRSARSKAAEFRGAGEAEGTQKGWASRVLATWLWWTQIFAFGAALVTAVCTFGQWHLGARLEEIRSEEARALQGRVKSEIGMPWPSLTPEARDELKSIAVDMLPLASSAPPKMPTGLLAPPGPRLVAAVHSARTPALACPGRDARRRLRLFG